MRKKKQNARRDPARLRWEFDPNVPTYDFFEGQSLDDAEGLCEAAESFIYWLENGSFATWEAVACMEQGLPLTAEQEELLEGLLNFGDPDDEEVLYIDETPRTSEPWHVILNKIAPHLLIEPFDTSAEYYDEQLEGWNQLTAALREHGRGLSLPAGASSVEEAVPADVRHRLWLQHAFCPPLWSG